MEITAINNTYLEKQELNVIQLGSGMAWLDTGTPGGMLRAQSMLKPFKQDKDFT